MLTQRGYDLQLYTPESLDFQQRISQRCRHTMVAFRREGQSLILATTIFTC